MSTLRRFITNISWNVLGKICVQLLLFALAVLITRYLGKERLGIYATLLVIPAFVRILSGMGLEPLLNKLLPEFNVNDPTGCQGRYLIRWVLALRTATSILFGFVLYWSLPYYLQFIHRPELMEYRPILIFYFLAITLNSILSTLFMTLLQYRTVALVETLGALMNLLVLGVVVALDWGIRGVLLAYVLSTGIMVAILSGLAAKNCRGEAKPVPWNEARHLGWVSYVIGLFTFGLMTQSDVLLMNYFKITTAHIGYYHLATGLAAMIVFVLSGIGPLALSLFSESFARDSYNGLSRVWCEIVGFASLLTLPIFVFAIFNAETLITFIFGNAFAGAAAVFGVYLVFFCVQTVLGADFTVSALFTLQRRDTALRSTIEGSVLNVALNILLIPRYGVMGAVAATGSVMVYMVLRQLYVIQKQVDIRAVFPVMGKCLFLALAASVPMKLVGSLFWDHVIPNGIVYLISLVLLLVWFKPLTEEQRDLLVNIHPGLKLWTRWFIRDAVISPAAVSDNQA